MAFTTSLFAQTIVFSENFDTPATQNLWTIGDLDGDNDTWEFADAIDAEEPSFSGEFAWSWSWFFEVLTPDNTLTSPVISLPNNSELNLSFKVSAADDEAYFEEHYAVYVIPANATFTGNETAVYEETLDAGYFEEAKLVNVDVSEYAGQDVQLVFRHYDCQDILYIGLDDVEITSSALGIVETQKNKQTVYKDQQNVVRIKGLDNVQQVKVFDVTGKLILNQQTQEVNIHPLPKGIYIVNFYSDKEVVSRKVIR